MRVVVCVLVWRAPCECVYVGTGVCVVHVHTSRGAIATFNARMTPEQKRNALVALALLTVLGSCAVRVGVWDKTVRIYILARPCGCTGAHDGIHTASSPSTHPHMVFQIHTIHFDARALFFFGTG